MQHNYDKFYSYVDMKSILGSLMQDTGKDLMPPDLIPKGNLLGELGVKLKGKVLQQLSPQVVKTLQKDVFNKIINKYLETLTPQDLLALQAAVTMADIKQEGDMADVILNFPKGDGSLHRTMFRSPQDRCWRVTSVSYEDLVELVKKMLL